MSDAKSPKPTRHFTFKFGRECHSFPAHWLYHICLSDHGAGEVLTLSFTRHNVHIGGRNLTAIFEELTAERLREFVASPLEPSTAAVSDRWVIHSIRIEKRDDDDDD